MANFDIRLPYGVGPDGRMVSVADVERGSACECTCPGCGAKLVAKKGDVLRHHFAHLADGVCANAGETMLHRLAKQVLADEKWLIVPEARAVSGRFSSVVSHRRRILFDHVGLEVWADGIRPDAVGAIGDRTLFIEFRVSHASDARKLAVLAERKLPCIEVDLSEMPPDLDASQMPSFILEHAPRKWLFNSRIEEETERLAAEDAARQAAYEAEKAAEESRTAAARDAERKREMALREREMSESCKIIGVEWDKYRVAEIPDFGNPQQMVADGGDAYKRFRSYIHAIELFCKGLVSYLPHGGISGLEESATIQARITAIEHDRAMALEKQRMEREAARVLAAQELLNFREKVTAEATLWLGTEGAEKWLAKRHKNGAGSVNQMTAAPHDIEFYMDDIHAEADAIARASQQIEKIKAELIRRAADKIGSVERATVWAQSTNLKLGRRRPIDVARDEASLNECLRVL